MRHGRRWREMHARSSRGSRRQRQRQRGGRRRLSRGALRPAALSRPACRCHRRFQVRLHACRPPSLVMGCRQPHVCLRPPAAPHMPRVMGGGWWVATGAAGSGATALEPARPPPPPDADQACCRRLPTRVPRRLGWLRWISSTPCGRLPRRRQPRPANWCPATGFRAASWSWEAPAASSAAASRGSC